MNKLAIIAVSTIALFGMAQANTAALKIGLVDPVAVYQISPQGQSSVNVLRQKMQPQVQKLQKQQKSLLRELKALQKNAPTMTKAQVTTQEKRLLKDQQSFKRKVLLLRKREAEKEQKVAESFRAKFDKAVIAVAKSGKYSLILSSQAVAYVAPDLKADISKKVIAKMKK